MGIKRSQLQPKAPSVALESAGRAQDCETAPVRLVSATMPPLASASNEVFLTRGHLSIYIKSPPPNTKPSQPPNIKPPQYNTKIKRRGGLIIRGSGGLVLGGWVFCLGSQLCYSMSCIINPSYIAHSTQNIYNDVNYILSALYTYILVQP